MPTIDVHVHTDGIRLPRRRQMALSALAGAAASAVILASAQLAVGWQNSADSALLLSLGYAAQFAAIVQVLSVPLARAGDRVTGLSLGLFVAAMFPPMLYGHAARLAVVSDLYLVNVLVVLALAVATVRATADLWRRARA